MDDLKEGPVSTCALIDLRKLLKKKKLMLYCIHHHSCKSNFKPFNYDGRNYGIKVENLLISQNK